MTKLIRTLDWKAVAKALDETPDLIDFRGERAGKWLERCDAVPMNGAAKLNPKDSIKLARLLIEHGLEADGAAFVEDEWKATPLWCAIGRGRNIELAQFLIDEGAEPNHALWSAIFSKNIPAIRLLVRSGADVDLGKDWSPLVYCARWGHFAVARELLGLGANVNLQGSKKMTALHYMVQNGADTKHIRMMLDHGARVDLAGASGATVLEMMRRKRDPHMRKLAEELQSK